MFNAPDALSRTLKKLMKWVPLDPDDQQAVLQLPFAARQVQRGTYIVREGDEAIATCVLLSGFAIRHKIVGEGARQILSVQIAGDLLDLHNSVLGRADHNVQALTVAEVASIPRAALMDVVARRPAVGLALWIDTLVDGSISREWLANVGRREARVRTCHLFCELGVRLYDAGLGRHERFELPMTQEELGDAMGLTPVHVNRMLQGLTKEGLIERRRASVFIKDFGKLATAGDFRPDYLHMA